MIAILVETPAHLPFYKQLSLRIFEEHKSCVEVFACFHVQPIDDVDVTLYKRASESMRNVPPLESKSTWPMETTSHDFTSTVFFLQLGVVNQYENLNTDRKSIGLM